LSMHGLVTREEERWVSPSPASHCLPEEKVGKDKGDPGVDRSPIDPVDT
jgi:hypothetical protein